MSDILYFDESTNQFFRTTDEYLKTMENQMNEVLQERLSEGNEVVTLSEVIDALGVEETVKNEDDMDEPKERRQYMLLVDTKAEDWTREQKRDIIDVFNNVLSRLDHLKSETALKANEINSDSEAALILKTLYMGEQNGLNTAWLEIYDVMKELKSELYPDKK